MKADLFLAVLFQLFCKGHHLSLKLLLRSNFRDLFLTVTIWAGSRWSWSLLLLFANNWLRLMLLGITATLPNFLSYWSLLFTWPGWRWTICISSSRLTSSSTFLNWRFARARSLRFRRLRFCRRFTLYRIGPLYYFAFLLIWILLLTFALLPLLLFLPLWLHDVIHQII